MHKIILQDSLSTLRVRLEQKREPAMMLVRGVINDALQPGRTVIWCWDGQGARRARQEIFPGYKQRPPTPNDIYKSLNFLRELLALTPAWQCQVEGYEADDMIAALVEKLAGDSPIEIHTRDGDLAALCRPGVTCTAPIDIPPELIPLYKICVGDSSDTIPGIKGFGKGTWANASKPLLRELIDRILAKEPWNDKLATAIPLPPGVVNWLSEPENQQQLILMWRCIRPLPISDEKLNQGLKRGTYDPVKLEALMRKYLL